MSRLRFGFLTCLALLCAALPTKAHAQTTCTPPSCIANPSTANVNAGCPQLGITLMTTDRQSIFGCLQDSNGNLKWKMQIGTSNTNGGSFVGVPDNLSGSSFIADNPLGLSTVCPLPNAVTGGCTCPTGFTMASTTLGSVVNPGTTDTLPSSLYTCLPSPTSGTCSPHITHTHSMAGMESCGVTFGFSLIPTPPGTMANYAATTVNMHRVNASTPPQVCAMIISSAPTTPDVSTTTPGQPTNDPTCMVTTNYYNADCTTTTDTAYVPASQCPELLPAFSCPISGWGVGAEIADFTFTDGGGSIFYVLYNDPQLNNGLYAAYIADCHGQGTTTAGAPGQPYGTGPYNVPFSGSQTFSQ